MPPLVRLGVGLLVIGFCYTLGCAGALIIGGIAARKADKVLARHFEDFRDEPEPPKVIITHTYHHNLIGGSLQPVLEG